MASAGIPQSGASIRGAYARFDAEKKFALVPVDIADPEICRCGAVVKGWIKPWQCPAFGKDCTPDAPLGALMLSSESACAAHYRYAKQSLVELPNAALDP